MVSTTCLKYFCLAYNIFYGIIGAVTLGFCGVYLYRLLLFNRLLPPQVTSPLYVLTCMALLVLISTWLGWKGITREHMPHIIAFGIVVTMIIAVEISVSIWCFVEHFHFQDQSLKLMENSFALYQENPNGGSESGVWERLQSKLLCCGLDGPSSYLRINKAVPATCCIANVGPEGSTHSSCSGLHQRSCSDPFLHYIEKQMIYTVLLGAVAALLKVCGPFSYYYYVKAWRRDKITRHQQSPAVSSLMNNSS